MPEPLWIYRMALLYCTHLTSCSAMADACDSVSHDQVTRMLQGSWSGHRRLDLALRALCSVAGGSLSVDDPVVAQPSARLLGEAAWVWSNQDRKVLFGGSVVLLVWTDGHIRIPLAFRVWQKGAPPNTTWPWSCSVLPAIGSGVSPLLCCLTPGIPRRNC